MKTCYLGLPYSHPSRKVRWRRFNAANRAAAHLFSLGYNCLSPISHSHPISLHMDNSQDSEFWTAVDEYWQRQCDELIILTLDGWRESVGLKKEINLALQFGQKVFFMDYDTMEISNFYDEV